MKNSFDVSCNPSGASVNKVCDVEVVNGGLTPKEVSIPIQANISDLSKMDNSKPETSQPGVKVVQNNPPGSVNAVQTGHRIKTREPKRRLQLHLRQRQ